MAHSAQIGSQSASLMMEHVSDLIAEAARLRKQALERVAGGDKAEAASLYEYSASIATNALSFRYELANAHADSNDADGLIATLDKWAARIEFVERPTDGDD
jgi:hypothetical protein